MCIHIRLFHSHIILIMVERANTLDAKQRMKRMRRSHRAILSMRAGVCVCVMGMML